MCPSQNWYKHWQSLIWDFPLLCFFFFALIKQTTQHPNVLYIVTKFMYIDNNSRSNISLSRSSAKPMFRFIKTQVQFKLSTFSQARLGLGCQLSTTTINNQSQQNKPDTAAALCPIFQSMMLLCTSQNANLFMFQQFSLLRCFFFYFLNRPET